MNTARQRRNEKMAVTSAVLFLLVMLCSIFASHCHAAVAISPVSISSIAALRALTPGAYPVVTVTGYYGAGTDGGGPLYWSAASTATPDSCTCYKPSSNPTKGRWLRPNTTSINVRQCGAKGDGTTNDKAAVQAAVNSISTGIVYFPSGTYNLRASGIVFPNSIINLKTTVDMKGDRAKIVTDSTIGNFVPFFQAGAGINNVRITGFEFDGRGTWTAIPFANPYEAGNSVGFTNNGYGIAVTATASDIWIQDCVFHGLGQAGVDYLGLRGWIQNNHIYTMGKFGMDVRGSDVHITANQIAAIQGNLTSGGDVDTANSKFADGIYLDGAVNISVLGNHVYDVRRICITLERSAAILNSQISISNNIIEYAHGQRGTEINAGIWSEAGQSDNRQDFTGNVINNCRYGIVAYNSTVIGNKITQCSAGILGSKSSIIGNNSSENNYGVLVSSQVAGDATKIQGNTFRQNVFDGIDVDQCHGNVMIKANDFEDNGQFLGTITLTSGSSVVSGTGTSFLTQLNATDVIKYKDNAGTVRTATIASISTATTAALTVNAASNATARRFGYNGAPNAGIRVNQYYADSKISVQANAFISSINDSGVAGQMYGIQSKRGGTIEYDAKNLTKNDFYFTGDSLASYPTCLNRIPVSYGIDNNDGTFTSLDLAGWNGNQISKMPIPDYSQTGFTGYQRQVDLATAAPTSGSYRAGDFILFSNIDSTRYFQSAICTMAGTPGTWQLSGLIANAHKITGDTASGGNTTITSTSHATKGKIYFGGTTYFDETLNSFASPALVTPTLGVASATSINFGGSALSTFSQAQTATLTLTGCTTSPTVTANYTIIGNVVTIYIPAVSATSNSTAMTLTGGPAAIRPTTNHYSNLMADIVDNGTSYAGVIGTGTAGTFTVFLKTTATAGLTGTFTNTGTKGLGNQMTFSYNLN